MENNMKKTLEDEFLSESNAIEREYSITALRDARAAWRYIRKRNRVVAVDVLKIHYHLMKNINPHIAGKFRGCDVFIGGERRFFVSNTLFKDELQKLCKEIMISIFKNISEGGRSEEENEKICKKFHVDFENIHPFEDGNGRTGRILWQWHRAQMGLDIKVIHTGEEQFAYYKWFKES